MAKQCKFNEEAVIDRYVFPMFKRRVAAMCLSGEWPLCVYEEAVIDRYVFPMFKRRVAAMCLSGECASFLSTRLINRQSNITLRLR